MEELPNTIDIRQLWAVFSQLKRVNYGEVLRYPGGFESDSEMIFNSLQKELYAQSKISPN